MFIETDDLIDIVRFSGLGAAPREAANVVTTIDTLKATGLRASLNGEASKYLQALPKHFAAFLLPEKAATLEAHEVFGVEIGLVDAVARSKGGRHQIIVFDGLRQIVMYYADLLTVLNLLQQRRGGETIMVVGSPQPEAQSFSDAAFSIMADYVETGRSLPTLDDILGSAPRRDARIGYLGALLFILFHEVGHRVLGHTESGRCVSERAIDRLEIDEAIGPRQADEFEADAFALRSFKEDARARMLPSVLFFLGPFSFLEAFGRTGTTHPLAVNRAARLAGMALGDKEGAEKVRNVIASQAQGYAMLAARRRTAGGSSRARISESMPLATAYAIVNGVKEKVKSSMGVLDYGRP